MRAQDLPEYLKTRPGHAGDAPRPVHFQRPIDIDPGRVGFRAFTFDNPAPDRFQGTGSCGSGRNRSYSRCYCRGYPLMISAPRGSSWAAVVALPFVIAAILKDPGSALWLRSAWALVYALLIPPITAFLALNFTGSTTFTSRTGVRQRNVRLYPDDGLDVRRRPSA